MSVDAAQYVAVQAVMHWRKGLLLSSVTWPLSGAYAPLLKELQACLLVCEHLQPRQRAVICGDLWSIMRTWPRFAVLVDAVHAYERRVRDATHV